MGIRSDSRISQGASIADLNEVKEEISTLQTEMNTVQQVIYPTKLKNCRYVKVASNGCYNLGMENKNQFVKILVYSEQGENLTLQTDKITCNAPPKINGFRLINLIDAIPPGQGGIAVGENYFETTEATEIIVDLGRVYSNVSNITLYMKWENNLRFKHKKISISENSVDWIDLYNSDITGDLVESQYGVTQFLPKESLGDSVKQIDKSLGNEPIYKKIRYLKHTLGNSSIWGGANIWTQIIIKDENDTNVAFKKPVFGSHADSIYPINSIANITNGHTNNANKCYMEPNNISPQWVMIDLGDVYENLKEITIILESEPQKSYATNKVEVSENGINWHLIYQTNNFQPNLPCTPEGFKFAMPTTPLIPYFKEFVDGIGIKNNYLPVRYIKDSISGSLLNGVFDEFNRWVEIKAFDTNGTNVALFKPCYIPNVQAHPDHPYSFATNGNINNENEYAQANTIGTDREQSLVVDLGKIYNDIKEIKVWHNWVWDGETRIYLKHKIQISNDNINWVTIWDSDRDGGYNETFYGKMHKIPLLKLKDTINKIDSEVTELKNKTANINEKSITLKSPDNSKWNITVSNNGTFNVTKIT